MRELHPGSSLLMAHVGTAALGCQSETFFLRRSPESATPPWVGKTGPQKTLEKTGCSSLQQSDTKAQLTKTKTKHQKTT